MCTTPENLGFDCFRHVHFNRRPPHCACRYQHCVGFLDPGAPNRVGPPVENDAEEQTRHCCHLQLRIIVSCLCDPLSLKKPPHLANYRQRGCVQCDAPRLLHQVNAI